MNQLYRNDLTSDDEASLDLSKGDGSESIIGDESLSSEEASLSPASQSSAFVGLPVHQRVSRSRPPKRRRSSLFRMMIRRVLIGGFLGGFLAALSLYITHTSSPRTLPNLSENWIGCSSSGSPSSPASCDWISTTWSIQRSRLRNLSSLRTISSIIGSEVLSSDYSESGEGGERRRQLALNPASEVQSPALVIAGKMSVEDGPCNIAQFDLRTNEWSLTERIQLSLYNSYSGGEVYSLLANHTYTIQKDAKSSGQSGDFKK